MVLAESLAGGVFLAWLFYDAWYGIFVLPFVYVVCRRLHREDSSRKEQQTKTHGFQEMLELLDGFLRSGASLENAFLATEEQMKLLGQEYAGLTAALHSMNQRVQVSVPVEQAFLLFASQMELEEAETFGEVLLFAKRVGGNYGKNVQSTAGKLREKIALQEEIQTMMAERRLELRVMLVLPLVMMTYIRLTSADLISVMYHSASGVGIMTVCLAVYVALAFWGRKIMEIRI